MRPWLYKACEEIDAAIFSGDTLYQPEELAALKKYLQRWNRAVAEHEAIMELPNQEEDE